jgi:hypothetical protein
MGGDVFYPSDLGIYATRSALPCLCAIFPLAHGKPMLTPSCLLCDSVYSTYDGSVGTVISQSVSFTVAVDIHINVFADA